MSSSETLTKPMFQLREGKRYRIRVKNASDDIHRIHLHRHTFEVTRFAGQPMSGLMKDVVMGAPPYPFIDVESGVVLVDIHQLGSEAYIRRGCRDVQDQGYCSSSRDD